MKTYYYKAKSASGKVIEGKIKAASDKEVILKLENAHYEPIMVKLEGGSSGVANFFKKIGGGVKPKDLQVFTRQFSVLINSGVPIIESISSLAAGTPNKNLKKALLQVHADVLRGNKLSEAMAVHDQIFSPMYINLVRAGEEGGVLDEVLERLAIFIEKNNGVIRKVKGAMVYPAITLTVAIGAVIFILLFVVPSMEDLYESVGQELPALTQHVMKASEIVTTYWYYLLFVVVGIPILFKIYAATDGGKKQVDGVLINMPLFKDLVVRSSVAQLSRTMATLLKSGVQLTSALDISAASASNEIIAESLRSAKTILTKGGQLSEPIQASKHMPLMVSQMVSVGEQTGQLDQMFSKIADFYEDEVENAVDSLTSMIEPLMIVFIGGIVGTLVIAMFLPIMNLANTVGG